MEGNAKGQLNEYGSHPPDASYLRRAGGDAMSTAISKKRPSDAFCIVSALAGANRVI